MYCEFCGKYSNKYELCNECYELSKENYIIKNDKGIWIKNIKKGIENRFYNENKSYFLKKELLNEFEMRFYKLIRKSINYKYLIIPQINLQTIIETDSNKRNDELYRNVDFGLFYAKSYKPFLLIELNGSQHYTNSYNIERDKSVKNILKKVELPLLTIDIREIKKMTDKEIIVKIKQIVKKLNPNFFKRLFTNYTFEPNFTIKHEAKYNT